ncbi:MAG: hypothetical protein ACUVWR_15085 [Anaerolineae bacterium]
MSAVLVVGDMAAERERVKKLVDLVPAKHLDTAARILRGLVEEPVLVAFAHAPVDDEGELSDEAIADLAEADEDVAAGRVMSTEELCRRLGKGITHRRPCSISAAACSNGITSPPAALAAS